MKTIKTLGDVACVFLACIGAFVICAFAYYSIFNKDVTIGINNIDDQVALDVIKKIESDKDLTQEQIDKYKDRYFMNINFYDNSKNNGVELAELRFDYFMSYRLQEVDYRSTGMQYVGTYADGNNTVHTSMNFGLDWIWNAFKDDVRHNQRAGQYVDPDFYYYDTTNGINWNGGGLATELKRDTHFIIKIDGRPFSIQLTGTYQEKIGEKRILFGLVKTADIWGTVYYTYSQVFKEAVNAVRAQSAGYGDYYITLDLSKYFTVREFDTDTGKFKTDNVTDIIKNYCVLKFSYNENGAISSNQSLFGLIENNRKFAIGEGRDYDTTYWQSQMVYTLTEKDLTLRYSGLYEGNFASLSLATRNIFANMPPTKINIVLELTDKNKIIGLDYDAFKDFELNSISIRNATDKDITFYFLENCLQNTTLELPLMWSLGTRIIQANTGTSAYKGGAL